MKVLFVHQYCGPMGGAEVDVLMSATSLKSRGHSTILLYSTPAGADGSGWESVFAARIQLDPGSSRETARRVLRDFSPDVIFFHSLPDLAVLEELLESGLPLVRRVHDHRLYCMRGGKYNYFTRAVCRRPASWRCVFPCLACVGRDPGALLPFKWVSYSEKKREIKLNRQCDCLFVYSEYQKEELVRNGFDPEKIVVRTPSSHCGGPGLVSSFGENNLILFVGQVIRGKGVDVLLRALALVKAPFEAAIVGDGNHRRFCERLSVKLGLGGKVKFHGFVPHDQVQNFYQEASVMAVSSVWPEPFGLVGREAMRHGLPVVAFDSGGIREWLFDGENGYLAPWMDVAAFAERIERLLRDKDLARRLGQRGRELIGQQPETSSQDCPVEHLLLRTIARRNHHQYAYES